MSEHAYDFNPEKEAATVKIRILPFRYVRINGKMYHVQQEVVLDAQGRRVLKWVDGPVGTVMVPPRVANALTIPEGADVADGVRPTAIIVETGVSAKVRRAPDASTGAGGAE